MIGRFDFVFCSDVLEHVPPPAQMGFDGLFSLLKPGGILIFSVPYNEVGETIEHYPNLHEWEIKKAGEEFTLVNKTRSGLIETFKDLIFHGSWGKVLEMRVFGLTSIEKHIERSGFVNFTIMDYDVDEFGIISPDRWGRSMTAERPINSYREKAKNLLAKIWKKTLHPAKLKSA